MYWPARVVVFSCTCLLAFDVAGQERSTNLFDLDFHDFARVLDDLGDVCAMTGTDFTQDTLVDENDTADEPVALQPPVSWAHAQWG
jgi:hypothetical protein